MKTLYNTVQQYESILDPDQNKVMDRMTDEMIRQRIREYCTYNGQKYKQGECWPVDLEDTEITKIDKDNKGWYIETKSPATMYIIDHNESKSFYEYCLSHRYKIDKQKGFLIEDIGIYFRWRKHEGCIEIADAPYFESTEGLPEELTLLLLDYTCRHSRRLNIRNKIKVISIWNIDDLKIFGNGCKDVIIDPNFPSSNIIAPNGTKIHKPISDVEYNKLMIILAKL